MEILKTQIDLGPLIEYVENLRLHCPPVSRSQAVAGWALQGHSDSYQDGWGLEFCPYNGPNNRGPIWTPKTEAERILPSIQDFKVPTAINSKATLQLLDRLTSMGLNPRRARIIRLSAGSKMNWHKDGNKNIYQVRLHIPIITNEDCFFDTETSSTHMPADGSIYLVHINRFHRVRNEGKTDRFHFVVHIWDQEKVTTDYQYDWKEFDYETDHPDQVDPSQLVR